MELLTRESHINTLLQHLTAERDFESDHKRRHTLSQHLIGLRRLLDARTSSEPDAIGWTLENLTELGNRLVATAGLNRKTVQTYASWARVAIRQRLSPESRRYNTPLRGRVVPSAVREISPERKESASLQNEIETLLQTAVKLPTLGRVISRVLREIANDVAV